MKCPKCGTITDGNICPKCGFSFQNNDIYSNNINLNEDTFKQKHSAHKPLIIVGIFFAVFGCICFFAVLFNYFMPYSNSNGYDYDEIADTKTEETVDSSLMTLYEFEKIRVGMSKSEVYDIVGSHGELSAESGSLATDDYYQMYSYEGYGDLGANAILTFYNLKLESKTQFGLKGGYSESTKSKASNGKIKDVKINIAEIGLEYDVINDSVLDGVKRITAKYKNNTNYTITSLRITAIKKQGDNVFLLSTDTVKPGEISPSFDIIDFDSMQKSDIELIDCTIHIADENGAESYVKYDYKTDTYEIF